MGTRMSLETRRELLEQLKERYRWANRTERSRSALASPKRPFL